ncbi:hypothetical protein [Thermosynechococcus sp.]|uniref:hypothetical protein n=1 Tax=Thermosynechococcus sp. TaxID=2814275 RepID=UPI00391DC6C2
MKSLLLGTALALTTVVCFQQSARADSPLTSTPFYEAYTDVPIVMRAKRSGRLDLKMSEWLSSPQVPTDYKAALINALGWDFNGKTNGQAYRTYLALRYGTTPEKIPLESLTTDELMALGYLTAMDNYFQPQRGMPFLNAAQERNSQSYAIAMVRGLVEAQTLFEVSWCQVWQAVNRVDENPQLKRDLRPKAREIILKYMRLYRRDC